MVDQATGGDRPVNEARPVPLGARTAPLDSRLRQIAPHLGVTAGERADSVAAWSHPTGELAAAIARAVRSSMADSDIWLAVVGFTTVFPRLDEHAAVRRALALSEADDDFAVLTSLLAALSPIIRRAPDLDARLEVVADAVVVDADFTGRSDHNTGVQRVLRETASRWNADHDLTLVCWNDRGTALRPLAGREIDRVVDWAPYSALTAAERVERRRYDDERAKVVVPVRSTIVEIEVAQERQAASLAALAAVSGNGVAIVGHDAIPIVSSQSQDAAEIERFARFLTVVKHASRIAGVSVSAATEYSGFVDAVRVQGLRGPDVVAVPLAMNPPTAAARALVAGVVGQVSRADEESGTAPVSGAEEATGAAEPPGQWPLVLVVGSQEPRKNHSAIVFAAGQLWAAGIRFRLRFIGGGTAAGIAAFDRELGELAKIGLTVEVLRGASDAVLLESYRQARFTVFPSLHEGFGLPVAESLALGVPVITSDHGSLREAAEGGGCLMVDARDDEAIRVAMERLLVDEELYQSLRAEAVARRFRTWNDYARDLWRELVQPVQAAVAQSVPARSLPVLDAQGSVGHPEAAALQLALADWFASARAEIVAARAREESMLNTARKIVPLTRFFVVRSREMGVPAASRAAFALIKRRVIKR